MSNQEMFERHADEIFKAAGCDKTKSTRAMEIWHETAEMLHVQMERFSLEMGMSWGRYDAYEKQKRTFIEDLKKMKAEHPGEI